MTKWKPLVIRTGFIFLVGTGWAFADDTDNDGTNTAIGAEIGAAAGAATGGAAGVAVGAAAGAAGGYVSDLEAGISRNEEKYREGTDQWQSTHDDWKSRQNNGGDE